MLKGIFFGFLLSNTFLVAQNLVGAGYVSPAPVSIAQGQIVTFFASGLGPSLAGITATLQQGSNATVMPIQSVQPVSLCPNAGSPAQIGCGSLVAITVQIPYEVIPACPPAKRLAPPTC